MCTICYAAIYAKRTSRNAQIVLRDQSLVVTTQREFQAKFRGQTAPNRRTLRKESKN